MQGLAEIAVAPYSSSILGSQLLLKLPMFVNEEFFQ
jgi:hypothetical protein